jgi:hypothetical protein
MLVLFFTLAGRECDRFRGTGVKKFGERMSLADLIQVPDEKRDPHWENHFFNEISKSNLKLMLQEPQQGPDNWPYMIAETSDQATEPAQKIMQWCALRGIGLVINPRKEYPDYVFTYGMLWHFKETGLFFRSAFETPEASLELKKGDKIHSGPPSPAYLPDYVRGIVREFFRDQAVLRPRILVMSTDQKHYDLVFSIESLGNPPENERAGIAEAISWFLPPHYSILLMSEVGLPKFGDL